MSARSNSAEMPVSEERLRAVEIARSLMSTPVTTAPSRARLRESLPELHCRRTSLLPVRSPRRFNSSGKRVLPPSRRNLVRSPRWLSCALTAAFQESRFCSRRYLRSTGGFYPGTYVISVLFPPRLPPGHARSRQPCLPNGANSWRGGGRSEEH